MERIFLFPGQGSQAVGMGKDLFDAFPDARDLFHTADRTLGYDISKLCFEGPEEELKLTQNTQPALLIVSTIIYRLLGIEPSLAAGHSLGEYSALVAAGAIPFEEAVMIVHKRGRYMQEAVPVGEGAMAAVLGVPIEEVEKAIREAGAGVVEVANWNSREQIVIAGEAAAVKKVQELLLPAKSILLPVSAPFHCRLMQSAEEKLARDLDEIHFSPLRFPVICNVDAKILHGGDEAREALKRQVTRTVLWVKSMEIVEKRGVDQCVELGSGRVLSGLMKRISRKWDSPPQIFNIDNAETLDKVRAELS